MSTRQTIIDFNLGPNSVFDVFLSNVLVDEIPGPCDRRPPCRKTDSAITATELPAGEFRLFVRCSCTTVSLEIIDRTRGQDVYGRLQERFLGSVWEPNHSIWSIGSLSLGNNRWQYPSHCTAYEIPMIGQIGRDENAHDPTDAGPTIIEKVIRNH
jgi:hypothetical protein